MLLGVALGGAQPPADADPAHKLARLRAKAAGRAGGHRRMRARVERLVEDDNEVREALTRTRVEQARTRRQVLESRRISSIGRRDDIGAVRPTGRPARAVGRDSSC